MARKNFLRIHIVNDPACPYVSQAIAKRKERRLLAIFLTPNSMRLLPPAEVNRRRGERLDALRQLRLCRNYRGPLPPCEVRNTSFQEPLTIDAQTKTNRAWYRTAAKGICLAQKTA